ncbi:MAG: AAC(3) family N-acetyltransferase, partial [Bacillota bacterium]|nr:AAC(3) family N-acetyltransferase [Bacillota bacterium]
KKEHDSQRETYPFVNNLRQREIFVFFGGFMEKEVIERSIKPYSKEDIKIDLEQLGVKKGDVVLVHSSLSRIGWVIGKEIALIQALIETVGEEGTIVMPSQSGDWTSPDYWQAPPVPKEWIEKIKRELPAYDPLYTPTREMGRIADAFFRYPGTIRSSHPQVSFSANGKLAKFITDDHALRFGLGKESPLQKLYDLDAKVLLLGVGYDRCTSMHLAEAKQKYLLTETQGSMLDSGWTEFEEIVYDDSDFEQIGLTFEKEKPVSRGMIGQAFSRLFPIRSVVDFATEWMDKNRKSMVNLSKEEFSKIYDTYMIRDFPEDELKPLAMILENPNSYLYGYYEQEIRGYMNCVFQQDYCLVDYFGIFEKEKNKGYGSKLLQLLLDAFSSKTIIIESEVPYDTISEKRLSFYLKNGFLQSETSILLYGVKYHILSNKALSKEEIEQAYSLFYPEPFRKAHFKVFE